MSNIEIINESLAVKRIEDALQDMDLTDLARLASTCCDGNIIVVHDGEGNVAAQDVAEKDIPNSGVFADGALLGYIGDKGELVDLGFRFQLGEPCSEQDLGEFMTAVVGRLMLPIVDTAQNQTIAWIYEKDSFIINGLNKEYQ